MEQSSAWQNWMRDIVGTYVAVDAQKQIIKAQTIAPPPTTNTTPIAPGADGAPVPQPIDRKWLIGGGIVAVLLLGAVLLKKA